MNRVSEDPQVHQDPLDLPVVLDLQVTVEIQDHQEPTDHQDLLVSPETMDEMETRVTQDLEDHLETLDHLDTVKVAQFSQQAKNTLVYRLSLMPLMVPLRIPPLHAGTFRLNLAPTS